MFSEEKVIFEKEDFKKVGIEAEIQYIGHFSRDDFYGWGGFEYSLYEFIEEPYYLVLENCSDNNDFDNYNIKNYYISKISEDFGTKIALKLGYYAKKLYENRRKKIIFVPEFLDKEVENKRVLKRIK